MTMIADEEADRLTPVALPINNFSFLVHDMFLVINIDLIVVDCRITKHTVPRA